MDFSQSVIALILYSMTLHLHPPTKQLSSTTNLLELRSRGPRDHVFSRRLNNQAPRIASSPPHRVTRSRFPLIISLYYNGSHPIIPIRQIHESPSPHDTARPPMFRRTNVGHPTSQTITSSKSPNVPMSASIEHLSTTILLWVSRCASLHDPSEHS